MLNQMVNNSNNNNNNQNNLNNLLQMRMGDIKNTPEYNQALKMTYGKTPQEIENMVIQLAQQKGVDLNLLKNFIGNR